ncbi:hypothetical protein Noca_4944 (plasmid) [Nocardioides sp. JS614]|nr:hypothetical protein Noca_4944 [Nocardioides sp. JS614]
MATTRRPAASADRNADGLTASATAQSRPEAACAPGTTNSGGTGPHTGPWGTGTRAVVGAGALAWGLAVPHQHPLLDLPLAESRAWGSLAGFVLFPLLVTLLVVLRGRSAPPLRLGHGAAWLVTAGVVALAQFFPVAVLTWIGATLLLLAVLRRGGCEVLAVPNLLLRRSDYLVCLPFSAIDAWESQPRRPR